MKPSNLRSPLLLGALALTAVTASADSAPTPDGSLTMFGITLYGTLDAGVQFQTHGAPQSDYFPAGTEAIIQKNSTGSVTSIGGNNLSQSKLGLKGLEDFGNGWSGIFKLETFINPWSGHVSDALKSLTLNNGKAVTAQATGVDSSIAGQFFGGAAYLGVSNKDAGTLTFGRQNGIMADGIAKYDPLLGSQAFSPIGWSGTAAGGGNTEDRRLDSSVKYDVTAGQIHFGAQYQPKTGSNPGTTTEAVLGWVFPGGSVDAYYEKKNDAIAAASLTAAQLGSVAAVCAGTATTTVAESYACASPDKALAGTLSDNTSFGLMGKYTFADNSATVSVGYEHINFQNPGNPLAANAGQAILGGYTLVTISNTAYPTTKTLNVYWAGLKYAVTPQFDVTGAYYRYGQNAYATGATAGCSNNSSSKCSGSENFVSVVGDYHVTKRFDIYGGAMYSGVQDGLANGYLNTSTIDPTVGFRYTF